MNVPPFAVLYVVGMVATAVCLSVDGDWRDAAREVAADSGFSSALLQWAGILATALTWPVFWAFYLWPAKKAPPP